jgi:hypothetical protein
MSTTTQPKAKIVTLADYRRALLIDTDDGPRPMASVVDPWQQTDFEAMDAGWQRVAGQTVSGGFQRAYLERGRGHSKTTDIAAMAMYPLIVTNRPITGAIAAADVGQAGLTRDTIQRLCHLNPFASKALDVQRNRIVGAKGSELVIHSSDAATSFGITPDFIICDEFTVWKSPDLWESLASAAAIRKDELVSLTFDDIDWESRSIVISADNSKNHKPREIPIDDEMFAMLERLRDDAQQRQPMEAASSAKTAARAGHRSRAARRRDAWEGFASLPVSCACVGNMPRGGGSNSRLSLVCICGVRTLDVGGCQSSASSAEVK